MRFLILLFIVFVAVKRGECKGKESCIPRSCNGDPGDIGSSCGLVSDGCGSMIHCGECRSGDDYNNLKCKKGICTCNPPKCKGEGGPCQIADGCGGTITCCTGGTGCCPVGGETICTTLISGICPGFQLDMQQESTSQTQEIKLLETVKLEKVKEGNSEEPNSNSWTLPKEIAIVVVGATVIIAGLLVMVKRRNNYHIESAHLLENKQPLY